ncbi:MAG: UPF0175 family protein [Deltaproteobacteria bacterium]
MAELYLKVPEDEIFPLTELSKIEEVDASQVVSELIKEWIKKEAVSLYKSGRISLSKASEIVGISVWEMVDLLKTLNVPLQIGKTS